VVLDFRYWILVDWRQKRIPSFFPNNYGWAQADGPLYFGVEVHGRMTVDGFEVEVHLEGISEKWEAFFLQVF
jgi:hypothetical protein